MIPGRLRLRFVVAAGLLVLTTVTASVWTFFALSRLSGVVTDTVRQSESVTAVTSRLAGALEREDDAVLLILAGDDRGIDGARAASAAVVDRALSDLFDVLGPDDERELAEPTRVGAPRLSTGGGCRRIAVLRTRRAGAVSPEGQPGSAARGRLTTAIRDRHFELAREPCRGRAGRSGRRPAAPCC